MGSRATSQELIDLGNRIRERRQEVCLSQEALAEKAGISPNTVSRVEGGQMAVTVGIFQSLLKALGCDANRILGIAVLPPEDGRRLEEMFCRVRNLKQGEQDVVVQTMKALMDGLEKNR